MKNENICFLDMISEKFFITNRFNEKLEVLKEYQEGKDQYSAILMVPGLAMDLHEWGKSFDEIADRLVKAGFLVLRFSFAGCGKSEGDFKEMTVSRQAAQVQDVFKYLQKEPLVDKNRIGVLAQSMAGPSVIQALPLKISSTIFLSAVFDPEESLKKVIQERNVVIDVKKITKLPRSDGSLTELGPQIWKDFKKLDLESKLEKHAKFPVLVLHGALDDKVSIKDAKQFFRFSQAKKELIIYPEGDHGFDKIPRRLRKEVLRKIIDWFKITHTN